MKKTKGEIWEIYRVNYEKNCFEYVGEMYFDYAEMHEWQKNRAKIGGWIKEWLRRYAEEHGLKGQTLERTVKSYVEE